MRHDQIYEEAHLGLPRSGRMIVGGDDHLGELIEHLHLLRSEELRLVGLGSLGQRNQMMLRATAN